MNLMVSLLKAQKPMNGSDLLPQFLMGLVERLGQGEDLEAQSPEESLGFFSRLRRGIKPKNEKAPKGKLGAFNQCSLQIERAKDSN